MRYSGERLVKDDNLLNPMRVENLARFNFFRKKLTGPIILDLGCGVGEGTNFLGNNDGNNKIYGVDLSYKAICYARENNYNDQVFFSCMDITNLAFKEGTFDAIISVEVIEHISDVQLYLYEAYRVLKRGGLFFLTTPNRLVSSPTPGSLWPDHVVEYSPSELADLLSGLFSHYEMFGEYIPIYEENIFRKLMHRIAPLIKPILPKVLRVRMLPMLQSMIKRDLSFSDVEITNQMIDTKPTIIACCHKSIE